MKVLLIDPYFKEGLKGFPLGLAYIAGALRKEHEVYCLDLTARATIEGRDPLEILKEELGRQNPQVVGITSTSPTHKSAIETARVVKQYKDIPVIKGGPHETNCAKITIRNNPEIDYSVVGEGEATILELVRRISNNQDINNLEGVVLREGNKVIKIKRRPLVKNLDNLPKPARDLFYLDERFNEYYSAKLFGGKKSTSVMTSRGCPYSCSFCSSKINWRGLRQRSVKGVVREIEELHSKGFRGFMFEDDMSLVNRGWFLEFAKQLKKRRLDIEYSLQTRVDAIDEEIAKALKNSGCKFMYFGLESGVQEILDRCNKGVTIKQAEKAFRTAQKYGIRCMASIQFGLPGEDLKNLTTVRETIRILNEVLRPDEVAVSYTSLYPGSPLSNIYGVTGKEYETQNFEPEETYRRTAHGGSHTIHPNGLRERKEDIERLLEEELRVKRFEVETFYKT